MVVAVAARRGDGTGGDGDGVAVDRHDEGGHGRDHDDGRDDDGHDLLAEEREDGCDHGQTTSFIAT